MNILLLNAFSDFFSRYGLIIILLVLLLAMIFVSYNRRKTDNLKREQLNKDIKPGVKVLTFHGVYGEVVSLTNTTDGIQVVIKTGDDKHVSYQKLHINAICGIDQSTTVIVDDQGNVVEPQVETEVVKEEPKKVVEEKEVEQPKKTTTKKSTSKKTTTKSTTK